MRPPSLATAVKIELEESWETERAKDSFFQPCKPDCGGYRGGKKKIK